MYEISSNADIFKRYFCKGIFADTLQMIHIHASFLIINANRLKIFIKNHRSVLTKVLF